MGEIKGEVVAVFADLEHFATWADGKVYLTGPRGPKAFASLAKKMEPGVRFSLADDGSTLVEVADEAIRVTDVKVGEKRWTHAARVLWGNPSVSPDGSIVALPEQGHVGLLDARTGTERGTVGGRGTTLTFDGHYRASLDSRLTLVRSIVFSPDGSHIAVTCSRSRPSWANHVVFVISMESGDIVGELHGHTGALDAVWLSDELLVTRDLSATLRVFDLHGNLRQSATPSEKVTGPIATDPAGNRVAFVAGTDTVVWNLTDGKVVTLADATNEQTYAIALGRGTLHVLDNRGHRAERPLTEATVANIEIGDYSRNPTRMAALTAVHIAGSADDVDVQPVLEPFARNDDFPIARTAYWFVEWQRRGGSLLKLLKASFANASRLDVLRLAALYDDAEMVGAHGALFLSWLDVATSGSLSTEESKLGLKVGLGLLSSLRSLDENDLAGSIVEKMFAIWPDAPDIAIEKARMLQSSDWKEAMRIANKVAAKHPTRTKDVGDILSEADWYRFEELKEADPQAAINESAAQLGRDQSSIAGWSQYLAVVRDVVPEMQLPTIAEAKATLPMKTAEQWAMIAQAYYFAGEANQAMTAYEQAIRLSPSAIDDGASYELDRWRREVDGFREKLDALKKQRAEAESAPQDMEVWSSYFDVLKYTAHSKLYEALEAFREQAGPRDHAALAVLASAYEHAYRYRAAIDHYEKALLALKNQRSVKKRERYATTYRENVDRLRTRMSERFKLP